MEKILNDVIKFKIHVQSRLEEYEVFVADEVERETEVLQRAEIAMEDEEEQVVEEPQDVSMVEGEERCYD